MKTILRISTLLVIILSAACGPNSSAVPVDVPVGPGAWIDAPLDGSTVPLAAYNVISHASDPAGISTFELSVNGQVVSTDPVDGDQAGQTIAHISQTWLPPAPGTYLIEVRAANLNGEYGPSAFVHVQVGDVVEVLTQTPTSGLQACIWTAAVNVFVRKGPGSVFSDITAVEAGITLPVVGQSQDQQYLAVQLNVVGYVPKAERFGLLSGDCDLPILTDPATPVPTDTPVQPQCSDGLDNDADGKIDFNPAAGVGDRQCTSADDNDEVNR